MPEGFNLATAIVEIIGDSGQLTQTFDAALAEGKTFAVAMNAVLGSIIKIALPGTIVLAIAELGKHTIEAAGDMALMSQKTGVTVTDLTRLEYAGKMTGVTMAEMQMAFKGLSKQMLSGVDDMGKPSTALKRLKIDTIDATGHMKSAMTVFMEVTDKFHKMGNTAERTALSTQLFTRTGMKMLPMMDMGVKGMEAMFLASDKLGYTLDKETSEAARKVSIAFQMVEAHVVGFARTVLREGIPLYRAMASVFENDLNGALFATISKEEELRAETQLMQHGFESGGKNLQALSDIAMYFVQNPGELLHKIMQGWASIMIVVESGILDVKAAIERLAGGIGNMKNWRDLGGLWQGLKDGEEQYNKAHAETAKNMVKALEDVYDEKKRIKDVDIGGSQVDPAVSAAIEKANQSAKQHILTLRLQQAEFDHNREAILKYRAEILEMTLATMKATGVRKDLLKAFSDATIGQQASKDAKEMDKEMDSVAKKFDELRKLMAKPMMLGDAEKAAAYARYAEFKVTAYDLPLIDDAKLKALLKLNGEVYSAQLIAGEKKTADEIEKVEREMRKRISGATQTDMQIAMDAAKERFATQKRWIEEHLTPDAAKITAGILSVHGTAEEVKEALDKAWAPYKRLMILNNDDLTAELTHGSEKFATDWESIFKRITKAAGEESKQTAAKMEQLATSAINHASDTLGAMFFDAFTGRIKSAKDEFKKFFSDMLREVMMFMARKEVMAFIAMMGEKAKGSGGAGWLGMLNTLIGAFTPASSGGSGGYVDGGGSSGTFGTHFATGGIVQRSTQATIGESGPEAVLPLQRTRSGSMGVVASIAGSSSQPKEFVFNQRFVLDANVLNAVGSSAIQRNGDAIITMIGANILTGGEVLNAIRQRG